MNHDKSAKAKAVMDKFDAVYEINTLLHVASQRLTNHIRNYNLTYEDSKRLEELLEINKYFHNRTVELLGDFANALDEVKSSK